MASFINLEGKRFGKLVVIKRVENRGHNVCWLCFCDCGKSTIVTTCNLNSGHSKSCGCLRVETTIKRNISTSTHKATGTRLFNIWMGMRERCKYKTDSYKNYSGRGITVCDDWQKSFEAFRDWALSNGYSDNLTIDRINNNGNYEPCNCRWATVREQSLNRSNTRLFQGKTLAEWELITGIPYYALANRIYTLHWDFEKTINTAFQPRKR